MGYRVLYPSRLCIVLVAEFAVIGMVLSLVVGGRNRIGTSPSDCCT